MNWIGLLLAILLGVYLVCTLVAHVMYRQFELSNLIMVHMLGSAITSLRFRRGPAAASNDLVRVTFDEDGPGLPPEGRGRLFDKFQRGNDEGATIGAGLGLAICRAIVRAHGGEISTGERPGGGTRFVFTLPASEAAA